MPAPSPEFGRGGQTPGSDYFPTGDFLESPNMASELLEIVDADVAAGDPLGKLDPDQVHGGAVKKRLGIGFWIASGWVVLITGGAILAPWLPIDNPNKITKCIKCSPNSTNWFGTDGLGRDIFSRVIWGGRVSITIGVVAILFGLLVGGVVGLVSGYFKGRSESLLMGAMDVLLAFPALLLALAIITFTNNHSVWMIALAIGIVSIAPVARLVRASTLVFSMREFVLASRTLGASNSRIIRKEILPNVMLPVLSFSIVGVAVAMTAEGALAFLGLSVAPPTATWGAMINEGRSLLEPYPYISMIPATILFLTVLSLNLAGDRVREYLDVKEGGL
jgi:peptide/nickel transport system permease protein